MLTSSVTVPGATLHVVDQGDRAGPPIVLLHAGIADSRAWDALTPLLVETGHRVVSYDRRGFGKTVTEHVEFSDTADLLVLLDTLGIGRAALVGNSMGGRIALDAAIESPDRVVAVIGVGAGLGGFEGDPTPEELAAFENMEALEKRLEKSSGDLEALQALVDLDVTFWVDGPGQPTDRVPAAIRDLVRSMDSDHYDSNRVQARPVRLRPPASERLGELSQPVLAVAGSLDATEVAQTAEYLAANAPNATAVIWKDVAHMIGLEVPERLSKLIVDFLAPLPSWS
ncbi:MAG: alpha/beta hydrolase [Acidimicrobiia bacterium]|nr:alpha/beta hydrolase [Acidimicrobiia bacterium]MDQ3500592.1 alpha/beta hydrolase [Actinomycetota bacterium]